MNITILGGGIMGLACAWRLATAGGEITLFERRRCGEGATLASLGALWPAGPHLHGPLQTLHRASLREFESFTRELAASAGMPVRYRRGGRLELLESAEAAAHARKIAAASVSDPFALEYLDAATTAAACPGLAFAPFGATRCQATAQVDVAQLVAALRTACGSAGVDIHEDTPAPAASSADATLITAGAWSGEVATVPIRPVKGQGIALRLPPDFPTPSMILKRGPIYLVPWPERGEMLVGSTTEPQAGFDEQPTPAAREELAGGAAALLPELKHAEILRHWAGLRPQNLSKGHLPVMGRLPGRRNTYVCAGHFKTGIGMAPLVSRLMAHMILTGTPAEPLTPFAPRGGTRQSSTRIAQ